MRFQEPYKVPEMVTGLLARPVLGEASRMSRQVPLPLAFEVLEVIVVGVVNVDVVVIDENVLVVVDVVKRVDMVVVVDCCVVRTLEVYPVDVDEVVVEDVIGVVLPEVTVVSED